MTATSVGASVQGAEALQRLREADPLLFLSPSTELSRSARDASAHLFSSLLPFFRGRAPPLDTLLADEAFDAEQIWSQIDLLSRPFLSLLRRRLATLSKDAKGDIKGRLKDMNEGFEEKDEDDRNHREEDSVEDEDVENYEDEEDEDVENHEEEEDEDVENDGDEEDEKEQQEDEEEEEKNGVEDRFLKIKELEEFVEEAERQKELQEGDIRGIKNLSRKKMDLPNDEDEDEEDEEDAEEEEEEEEEEDGDDPLYLNVSEDDEEGGSAANARYVDFYGGKSKKSGVEANDQHKCIENEKNNEMQNLSTHEKELQKMQERIKEMEQSNLEPKSWTMQGEVTATKRPKNSALEVDLDFEHNVRPPPVITEEVTASLEDLIRKRISEGHFDDVQKIVILPSKTPKEQKELDENKSKKSLAEIYEDEYKQNMGVGPPPLSVSDEIKNEVRSLFKKICFKLDALSHFHFAPKPIIEDMSIEVNVPALAMEEIAPVAVSDAAMLAPEEIFEGKGDIKDATELTQADRRRRRANKKRRFKAETARREAVKKARMAPTTNIHDERNQGSGD